MCIKILNYQIANTPQFNNLGALKLYLEGITYT